MTGGNFFVLFKTSGFGSCRICSRIMMQKFILIRWERSLDQNQVSCFWKLSKAYPNQYEIQKTHLMFIACNKIINSTYRIYDIEAPKTAGEPSPSKQGSLCSYVKHDNICWTHRGTKCNNVWFFFQEYFSYFLNFSFFFLLLTPPFLPSTADGQSPRRWGRRRCPRRWGRSLPPCPAGSGSCPLVHQARIREHRCSLRRDLD